MINPDVATPPELDEPRRQHTMFVAQFTRARALGAMIAMVGPLLAAAPLQLQGQSRISPNVAPAQGSAQFGQDTSNPLNRRISLSLDGVAFKEALRAIAGQNGVKLSYGESVASVGKSVTLRVTNESLKSVLDKLLTDTDVSYRVTETGHILLERRADSAPSQKQGTGVIKGRVVDSSSGAAMRGATVEVMGQGRTTLTDDFGNFVVRGVNPGTHTIIVKLLGYKSLVRTVTVADGKESQLRLQLVPTATSLSSVVTTATGAQRRVEVPNDIVKIDPAEIMERAPVRSIADLIAAAQVPGVIVQRQSGDPGAPVRFRMRGLGSISQSNDPVIIVDGVWIDASAGTPSRLDSFDPSTIESVEIIRGPSAGTLYGQDAANGVIVIKTRKGGLGRTRWNASVSRDWGEVYGRQAPQYVGLGHPLTEARVVRCNINQVLMNGCRQDSVIVIDPNHPLVRKDGAASMNRMALSVDGGSPALGYAISFGANDEIGARRHSAITNIRLRRLGYELSDQMAQPSFQARRTLQSTFTIMPRQSTNITIKVDGGLSNLRDNTLQTLFSANALTGSSLDAWSLDTVSIETGINRLTPRRQSTRTTNLLLSSVLRQQIGNRWSLSTNVGMDRTTKSILRNIRPVSCVYGNACVDTVAELRAEETDLLVTSWRSSLGGALPGFFRNILELRPAIGFDFRRNDRRDMRMVASGVPVGVDNFVDNSVGVNNGGSRISSTGATAGWYANTTIGLFSRIYFDLGLRQDIGSAIVSTNKARYPKIGTSWLMSDESFWKQNRFLETFRLRGAIGYAAVQPEFKDILGNYYSAYTYFDGQFVRSINISSLGNRGLLPERALEYELGFDATLFDDRLDLVATYARKENRNALVLRSAAPSVIPAHRKENVARIVNRNIELTANARLIETAALRLRTDYALTLSENWVAKLGNRVSPIENSVVGWIREGYPIGGIWNPVLLGYNDRNGDGLIADNEIVQSDSLVYIGWAQPRYRASYGLNVMIKNVISFDTRFAYQSQYVVDFTPSFGRGLEDLNASLAEQAVARVQQLGGRGSISDLRWNSASVTYHVSESIARKVGARSASISLQGSNLNLWTNYRGRDPSVNTSLASEISRDDGNILPVPRRFVLDFKVGF